MGKIDLEQIPKRHISEVEKQYIELQLLKLNIKRERTSVIFKNGVSLYLLFTLAAIIGFTNNYFNKNTLNLLVIGGLLILILSVLPFLQTSKNEEKEIISLIDYLMGKN